MICHIQQRPFSKAFFRFIFSSRFQGFLGNPSFCLQKKCRKTHAIQVKHCLRLFVICLFLWEQERLWANYDLSKPHFPSLCFTQWTLRAWWRLLPSKAPAFVNISAFLSAATGPQRTERCAHQMKAPGTGFCAPKQLETYCLYGFCRPKSSRANRHSRSLAVWGFEGLMNRGHEMFDVFFFESVESRPVQQNLSLPTHSFCWEAAVFQCNNLTFKKPREISPTRSNSCVDAVHLSAGYRFSHFSRWESLLQGAWIFCRCHSQGKKGDPNEDLGLLQRFCQVFLLILPNYPVLFILFLGGGFYTKQKAFGNRWKANFW